MSNKYILSLIALIFCLLQSGCSTISRFNAVEGKVSYDEHYATINGTDYESGEQEGYGIGITNQVENKGDWALDYNIYPDVSFETSKMVARSDLNQSVFQALKTRRLSAFLSTRGILFSPIGRFELNVGVGPSYFEAYNDTIDTSKVEPTFSYKGTYTIFLIEKLYASASFHFQESPGSTYGEYYSLEYKLGYVFGSF